MAMPCSGSLASRLDRALCLSTQGSASGEILLVFFVFFFFCQVQDSPSSKSYHTKSLRVSLGFSIAWCYRNRCLLVLSLWASVGCVTSKCWHCSTVSLFWSEEKESANIRRFHHQKIPALPLSFFPNCAEQMASTESNFKPRPRVSGT